MDFLLVNLSWLKGEIFEVLLLGVYGLLMIFIAYNFVGYVGKIPIRKQ